MTALSGRVAVVTGASAGIGAEVARQLAALGADLVLAARRSGPLDVLADEIRALGGRAEVVPTDVGRSEDCARLIEQTVARFGRLDILVNNAGLHVRGPFADRSAEEVGQMVDVNLRAPIVLMALALPHMRDPESAIVNVGSLAGFVPLPGAAVYSATKAGLRAVSRAMAREDGVGVRICVVSPGPVDTQFIMDHIDDADDVTFAQPMSTAAEVAELVVRCVLDGREERVKPRLSATMATLAYLFPGFGTTVRPLMARRGRAVKARYRARTGASDPRDPKS